MAAPLAETREALDALRRADYAALSSAHRLALLEALTHAVANTEQMRKCAPAAVCAQSHLRILLICMRATLSKRGKLWLQSLLITCHGQQTDIAQSSIYLMPVCTAAKLYALKLSVLRHIALCLQLHCRHIW